MCIHAYVYLALLTSFPPEVQPNKWVCQRPSEGAEESTQCQETQGGEDDSDTELTYGEVEQRLDLLQQHLNRCAGPRGLGKILKQHVSHVKPKHSKCS